MPIIDMTFKDGIFFAREVGRIERDDARLWAEHASRYAAMNPVPLVALVDARDVTNVTPEARKIFARATLIPNFAVSAVVTKDIINTQTSRIIALMAPKRHTEIFGDYHEALAYAEHHAASFRQAGV